MGGATIKPPAIRDGGNSIESSAPCTTDSSEAGLFEN
jgi:hypothetical protein